MAVNTHGADINELALGYFLNKERWFSREAETQFETKRKLVTNEEFVMQMGRAAAMADAVRVWLRAHWKTDDVIRVWWTARMGSLSEAVGRTVDQRKNPTDILIQLRDKRFLGLSAKSTKGKSDIGFKNPGLSTIEAALKINISRLVENAVRDIIKTYKLPESAAARKAAIRAKKAVQEATQAKGDLVLRSIRDRMFAKLKTMDQRTLRDYLLTHWMDSDSGLYPPYIKVTGFGTSEPFTAKVEDPLKNPKLTALMTERITVEKSGDHAIGVRAGGKKILKMRAKFESEKLASGVKFSGDPY